MMAIANTEKRENVGAAGERDRRGEADQLRHVAAVAE